MFLFLLSPWFTELKGQIEENLDFRHHYELGKAACAEGQNALCLQSLSKANLLRPGHQVIMYHLARAFAYEEQADSCSHYLTRALAINASFSLADPAFSRWDTIPWFKDIVNQQKMAQEPVLRSSPAAVLKERDLHIESIAFDPVSEKLFFGSVHKQKILSMQLKDSAVLEYKNSGDNTLWSVFGMKVDSQRRHLWVCSVATPYMIHRDTSAEGSSAIFKYHLETNQLLKTYHLNRNQGPHWFGDLTLDSQGDVYISDSRANAIYRITKEQDTLELFLQDPRFLSLQGLDINPGQRQLFISDYVNGPFLIDLESKNVTAISTNIPTISLKSIDGLYYYHHSLITTQNQVVPMRVCRYFLNPEHNKIIAMEYLENGNPLLNEPTLGVIIGKEFYYVANSQWGGYDENNSPKPWKELQDIQILKVKL